MKNPIFICVSADKSVRGPFDDLVNAPTTTETKVVLTKDQFAAYEVLKKANPGVSKFVWDGKAFAVAPIESLRVELFGIYNGLPGYAQDKFKSDFEAVRSRLAAGDVSGALTIITYIGFGMPQSIVDARDSMLALFKKYFPTVTATT